MTTEQLIDTYRYQRGAFYGVLAPGVVALSQFIEWKDGFPNALTNQYFFWLKESGNINTETFVYQSRKKWELYPVILDEFAPILGDNIIHIACNFLLSPEQNTDGVVYLPETFEIHSAGNAQGGTATLAEAPDVGEYVDPPGITYNYQSHLVELLGGNFELVDD